MRNEHGVSATPLFVVLVVGASADLLFAFDSISASFAVTMAPFIAYSASIFAILGLRALYFVLAGMVRAFEYFKPGIILAFVAVKILISDFYKIAIGLSRAGIDGVLLSAIAASWIRLQRNGEKLNDKMNATTVQPHFQTEPNPLLQTNVDFNDAP